MSKNKQIAPDLDVMEVETIEAAEAKRTRKVQTVEEKEILEAGVALMKEIGVSEKLGKLLNLVSEWNGEKETVAPVKEAVIEAFGGSENLKDYAGSELSEDMKAFQGISKAIPVLNNIKSFYARRENVVSTKKGKTVQVSIAGTTYNVDANYRDEIAELPASERKELLLAHARTTKADVIEEII